MMIHNSLLYTIIFLLFIGHSGRAQSFVPAKWLTTNGELQTGVVKLPTVALSKEHQLTYQLSKKEAKLEPANLEWLVAAGDTIFFRRYDGLRHPLLQLLTSGEVALYREVTPKRWNQYYWRYKGKWIAADNISLREDVDSLWTKGCVGEMNKKRQTYWHDGAIVGEDVQRCNGENPEKVYRILGPMEYRQWSVGTNIGSPLVGLMKDNGSLYSFKLGLSQQFRRISRGFYVDVQAAFFQFQHQEELLVRTFFSTASGRYDNSWDLTGMTGHIGIRLNLTPTRKMGPFLGAGYSLLIPFSDRQEIILAEGEAGLPGFPSKIVIEDAVPIGHGAYADIGWYVSFNQNWAMRMNLRLDPTTLRTNYSGHSFETNSVLASQDASYAIRFGSQIEVWVQKQFGQPKPSLVTDKK